MSKPTTTPAPLDDKSMAALLLSQAAESGKGLDFLLKVMNDKRSRVTFKIEIEVTRIPEKEK